MSTNTSSVLVFFCNGKKVEDGDVDPEWSLLYYLRNKLRLCGTKLGCGEGGCGACTVMLSKYDRNNTKLIHLPVNACLFPVCAMHGLAVTTVEGIGSTTTRLHPVQERIARAHGSQCGFCTPGIVMSMYTLLRNSPTPSMNDLEVAFQGNLCRCTGYRPIIDGYKTFTEEWELVRNAQQINECGMGDQCCKVKRLSCKEALFEPSEFKPYDPSQEPIFPPELKTTCKYDSEYLVIKGEEVTWYRPVELGELLRLKSEFPNAKLVVGNTEIGVEVKFKHLIYPVIIHPVQIPELTAITTTDEGVRVGASVTLWDFERALRAQIHSLPEHETRVFRTCVEMLNWFAGKQIRSVGAVGGNIMTGSPISDLLPVLIANEVKLEVAGPKNRTVLLDNHFFVGYRKNVMETNEILLAVTVPFSDENRYSYAFKQARRREDDIAIVNCAINVLFESKSDVIKDINLAFGGMSYKTTTAPKTRKQLKGLRWNEQMLETAYDCLLEDLPLDYSAPGGMILYRKSLTLSLFLKGFLNIAQQLQTNLPGLTKLDKREVSAITGFQTKQYKSSQYFTVVPKTQHKSDSLQRPIVHLNAYKQATGEAIYCDDISRQENELFLAFVTSTNAHANIKTIDSSEALAITGVHYFVSAKDLDLNENKLGAIAQDEKVFYDDKVTAIGQIIGGIVADTYVLAQKAARKVKVMYEELKPIISIQEAIEAQSYFGEPQILVNGNIEQCLKQAPHVLEGECYIGGQEHFYLETQCCLVLPKKEDNELEIFASTQDPTGLSATVARTLKLNQHKVITRVKRLGGGFGGKESKAAMIAVPVAIAAVKLNRPVRCMLDRDEDITMTGTRHPFLIQYKVGFDTNGKILGADVKMYSNAGYSLDLSGSVMEKAITHFENCYRIPTVRASGICCKTNLPSSTAFRGFGGPQGMYAGECILQAIADFLHKDPVQVSELNLYKEGDTTPYNQQLLNCTLDKCWRECIESSCYYQKRDEIVRFNLDNKYKKRGLSVIPTKFGIGYGEAVFLNQSGALVLVYADGSVLLSHGGVEMGQGLFTKMIQVASRTLQISPDLIHTIETSTDKVPNTSPTAASLGSDLNGMAVMNACLAIRARLQPYKAKRPNGDWHDWVRSAYLDRVSLSATGFYKTPGIGYDWASGEGDMLNYFTFGVACCEVEIDTLTGDHQVRKIDIVMDLGESLNPAIDIGQIEGAFMQGYGLFVLEEMVYSPNGMTLTRGPGTYKLPGFADIPAEFNVSLLKGVSNPRAVYSSKAVGEPPLFLGSSVFFAIKDAIKAARREHKLSDAFRLDSPATSAKIRIACMDNITARFKEPEPGSFVPWNVVP